MNLQQESLSFRSGSSGLGGTATAGDDPSHQASLRSSMDLGGDLAWDAGLRWVGRLPDPKVPAYVAFDTSLGWKVSDRLEIVLSGFNLLQRHHLEYLLAGAATGNLVDRSVLLQSRLRF
jgi:iron complex outermembrane receptor protein